MRMCILPEDIQGIGRSLSIRIRKTVDKWITEVMREKNVDKQSAAGMPD